MTRRHLKEEVALKSVGSDNRNRRGFLQVGAAAAAVAVTGVGKPATADPGALRSGKSGRSHDSINIGLVGCGGRGKGALKDNLTVNANMRVIALADLQLGKCESAKKLVETEFPEAAAIKDSDMHEGLDAYKAILGNKDVDLVIFATSPGFRPYHIDEAVDAGKHVFAEKPTCVDPAGYHVCVAAHEKARANGTAIVTGTQYRRQANYIGAVNKIRDGAIGNIVSATTRYCAGGVWYRPRLENMTTVEYQLLNWMHFIWLSGDQIVEQAVHNIDAMNWVMGSPPESAYGSGGRFTRQQDSQMWDNMAVDYVYPGDRVVSFMCRQIPRTKSDNGNVIYGTKGTCTIEAMNGGSRIVDRNGNQVWAQEGNIADAYKQEHKDLVDSIRDAKPIVELLDTANSSLTAVMGRMACYTGQKVTWDFVTQESKLDLFPKDLRADSSLPEPGHAVPGKTQLI
ncbi:MAG: Gfo/Idh/MocA family oxidoreductase [Pirellulales bacterium]|nr:Gfo/Idh/MocA family oxidoreductase [Pirellulales bacterium]